MTRELGRYALVKRIARGGMAEVWTGKAYGSSGFEKVVAIKLLAKDKVDQEIYQRALTDEALVQVHLHHSNIVDVYDLNIEGENPFLVMEYVEGIELWDLLRFLRQKGETLPLSLSTYIVAEVSKALSYAHQRTNPETGDPLHIVHRDVSPSNILLSREGEVKLSDFGIAKSALQTGVTQVGQIKGKYRYMSPEQARGEALDYRSDIFSLGLVFYECLTGQCAYTGGTDAELIRKAQGGKISIPGDLDPTLQAILGKLCATDPRDRYPDLDRFRRDLKMYASPKGGIAERDELRDYLAQCTLPELRRSVAAKAEADQWQPLSSSSILDTTGQIATLALSLPVTPLHRRQRLMIGFILAALPLLIFVAWQQWFSERVPSNVTAAGATLPANGSLQIATEPTGALVTVQHGDVRISQPAPLALSDLPFGTPIAVRAALPGYQAVSRELTLSPAQAQESLRLVMTKVQQLTVSFNAQPYAEVSVPGRFMNVETPIQGKILPPGDYSVTFYHPPSGRRATTPLHAPDGGTFVCSANMAIATPDGNPTASCRRR